MERPRISRGFESSPVTLNVEIAGRIGRQLADARQARSLTFPAIAARLLLSVGQVRALETADPDFFHNAKFYAAALRKYVHLLEVQTDLPDQVLVREAAVETAPGRRRERAVTPQRMSPSGSRWLGLAQRPVATFVVAVASGIALISAVLFVRSGPPERRDAIETGVPVAAAAWAERPVKRLPVATGPVAGFATAFDIVQLEQRREPDTRQPRQTVAADAASPLGYVSVGRATWVFVRYRDNSTVERVLQPGQHLALADVPVYVAVGAAEGAEVTIGARRVDPSGFVANGELRIGSAYLHALTSSLQ